MRPASSLFLLRLPLPVLLAVALAAPASAATLVVDDDRQQCKLAAYTAIQPAVDAAAPGDTVKVCPGAYEGWVRILKPLRLLGPKKGVDARSRDYGAAGEAVIGGTRPVLIEAANVTVDGFTLRVELDPEGEGSGVLVDLASGYRILNNLIDQASVPGVEIHRTSGKEGQIRRNRFRGLFGVRSEHNGSGGPLLIRDNLFINGGIEVFESRHAGIRILRNTLRHDAGAPMPCATSSTFPCRPFINIEGVPKVLVQRNKVLGSLFRAIGLNDVDEGDVVDNLLRNGSDRGIDIRDSAPVRVLGNRIAGFGGPAILLHTASGVLVEGNEVEDSLAGIIVDQSSDNDVVLNNIEDNASYGIHVFGESALSGGNSFRDNEVRGNGTLDCRDDTSGGGSFGTANTWTNNQGSRSLPAGLCPDR